MENNDNLFGDFEKEVSAKINDVSESDALLIEEQEYQENQKRRIDEWKKKRIGKITSSELKNVMDLDRYGKLKKAGVDYLLEVMHQRQTKHDKEEVYAKAFEWGHKYEEEALDYYNKITGNNAISGTYGNEEILFREPLEGFGDSPDGVTKDNEGVVEIKCPINGANHLRNMALYAYHDKLDYFWQLMGHMVDERVKWCDFVSYDPRYEDGDPNKIKIIRIKLEDVQPRIDHLKEKLIYWNELINKGNVSEILENA